MHPEDKRIFKIGLAVSLLISAALFWLIYGFESPLQHSSNLDFLPASNAICNLLSALSLAFGFWMIQRKQKAWHKAWMLTAFFWSACFLVGYVTHHIVSPPVIFEGQGWIRPTYFIILITHIISTVIGLPFILTTFAFAFLNKFEAHKKIARITFPLWQYISITGVLVYLIQILNRS